MSKRQYLEASIHKCKNCGYNYDPDLIMCPKCDYEEKEIFIYNRIQNKKAKF